MHSVPASLPPRLPVTHAARATLARLCMFCKPVLVPMSSEHKRGLHLDCRRDDGLDGLEFQGQTNFLSLRRPATHALVIRR